ncbi:phage tail fiber protein H (GpH) [Escherichia coli]|nr:phage tail fiber protein H (GpH) [Escherichia coli]
MAFDGSSDITLKASHVGAFALGKTGSTVANDKAVGWNWSSGAYNANIGGASTLIIHFYMETEVVLQLSFGLIIKWRYFLSFSP